MAPSSCYLVTSLLPLLILFLISSLATASVTVTICNTSTCDPASCHQFDPVDQDECMSIPDEPMPYSMFTCGDAYAVQTAFLHQGCGIYSARTSRVFRSNSCVPMQDDPPRYMFVTCNTSVTMTRTTSADAECKTTTSTEVVIGSCNNFVTANGSKYSIIPTCERGLAVARYFLDHNCTGAEISTFHNSDSCDRTFMKDPAAVKYTCPARTSERLCLSIQHPEYVLTGVGFAVSVVLTLPTMYCVVICYLLCGRRRLNKIAKVDREDNYVAMPTLMQDIAQLLQLRGSTTELDPLNKTDHAAAPKHQRVVVPSYGTTDGPAATQTTTSDDERHDDRAATETTASDDQRPVGRSLEAPNLLAAASSEPNTFQPTMTSRTHVVEVGPNSKTTRSEDTLNPLAAKINEQIAAFATISGLSSDTVRGLVCLAMSSTAASITFIILACVNQTLQTSDRSAITFWIALCGYASVFVVGVVPTPNIVGRRNFHIVGCWSVASGSKIAAAIHTASSFVFLILPPATTLVLQFFVLHQSDIKDYGVKRHWVLVAGATATVVLGCVLVVTMVFCYKTRPVLTFCVETAAFTCALLTAAVTEIWSLVECVTPSLG